MLMFTRSNCQGQGQVARTMARHRLPYLLIMPLLATATLWGDSLGVVTTPSGQNATSTFSWSQFGGDQTVLGQSFSGGGVTVNLQGPNSILSVVCGSAPCSWNGSGMPAGHTLLWTSDAANGGTGPVGIVFSSAVTGAGAYVQTDAPGQFTATIQAYNGSNLLGSFNLTSDSSGDALYIGVTDQSGQNITGIVLAIASCSNGCNGADFAVDTINIQSGSPPPQPVAQLSPGSLNFGIQPVNTTSASQTVTLTNVGPAGSSLSISSISASANFNQSNNCSGPLGSGASCTISVSFRPGTTGGLSGSLSVSDNAAGSPQSVGLSGTGVPALQFVPIAPCRIADTRGNGFSGAEGPPALGGQTTRNFPVGGQCGIPANAVAYSLNVTVVPSGSLGYLTVWPAGQPQPLVSTLNSDGRFKANAAIVPAGSNGQISVYASDATNVILDTDGYFVPAGSSGALSFYPLAPCRIADTRQGAGANQGPGIGGGSSKSFHIRGGTNSCTSTIPSNAQAYSLNFTAVPTNGNPLTYITVWPAGGSQPTVSTLNATTGTITANAAIVPGTGTNGDVSVYASDSTDLLIDVNGYFAAPGSGGLSLYAVSPCRVFDSRNPPNYNAPPFQGSIAVGISSGNSCAIPNASAYVLNATVVPSGSLTYLTLWPDGQSQPLVSTLNALDGAITSNMAIVPSTNGTIDAYASNPTQLILDISSYFAP